MDVRENEIEMGENDIGKNRALYFAGGIKMLPIETMQNSGKSLTNNKNSAVMTRFYGSGCFKT